MVVPPSLPRRSEKRVLLGAPRHGKPQQAHFPSPRPSTHTMGNHLSTSEFETTHLFPQVAPVVAIDATYVTTTHVHLDMGCGPVVRDVDTGASIFRVDGDRLWDRDGRACATMRSGLVSRTVYGAADEPLFDISTGTAAASCDVQDPVSGQRHAYSAVGTLSSSKAIITCDGVPVAKFRHNGSYHFGPCFDLDIAAGVDMALVVLLCLSLFPSDF
ncbi:Aste57867_949 [Aphanomyces stellatus]|uniref:Aste57867_949 protein n=1 Tax=Aphanomyces stellatus TaxID=120398 RepID=A0A485K909_9STRA|nr:hypothetical protein As57867_000948 [Aphanomyces stellatus]VFT78172.1 Aste57867_949 [Aphanomyces stellatus]